MALSHSCVSNSVLSDSVTPRTVAHQPPVSVGFSRQEHWSGLPCPPPGDLPNPGMEPKTPVSPPLQVDSLPLSHQANPLLLTLFPDFCVLCVKNPSANAGDIGDSGLIPGWGRSPGGGHGNPLQYSCLENPMDRGAWRATVRGVTKRQTQLSD